MPLKIGTGAPDFTLNTKTAQGLEDEVGGAGSDFEGHNIFLGLE
jgi:hypothetical protein